VSLCNYPPACPYSLAARSQSTTRIRTNTGVRLAILRFSILSRIEGLTRNRFSRKQVVILRVAVTSLSLPAIEKDKPLKGIDNGPGKKGTGEKGKG
jgi:hypothetical protein